MHRFKTDSFPSRKSIAIWQSLAISQKNLFSSHYKKKTNKIVFQHTEAESKIQFVTLALNSNKISMRISFSIFVGCDVYISTKFQLLAQWSGVGINFRENITGVLNGFFSAQVKLTLTARLYLTGTIRLKRVKCRRNYWKNMNITSSWT